MQIPSRFGALLWVLVAASLASCSRAAYTFQPIAPAYLGTAQVRGATTTPEVPGEGMGLVATTEAASAPAPVVSAAHRAATALGTAHSTQPAATSTQLAAPVEAYPAQVETKALKKQVKHRLLMSPQEAKAEGKSQLTATLLAFFLGFLGIHRFYLGYTGLGLLELFTFGVFGILSFIDFIRIITGSLKPKNGEYAKKL